MKDISKEDMIQLLQTQEDGVMSLSDGDTPYCIPFGHVLVNDTVYLSLFPRGRKWEIIQKNPKVCFNVYSWNDDHTEWSSVVVDGVMESVTDINEIESVVKALIVKMGMDPEAYLEKRMTYYRDNLDNPKALKIYRINSSSMGGKTMPTMMGE
jgi:nitroimidazol reductase NimA-like FMN-containing flavoprotein (pyridoxamine 5'-phosphate oxidase superfamily)